MRPRYNALVIPPKLVTGRVRRTPELTARFESEYDASAEIRKPSCTRAEYVDARYKLLTPGVP